MKNLNLISVLFLLCVCLTAVAQTPQAVYVSDAANFNTGPWQIAKFDESGTYEGALMNVSDGIEWPQDIIFLDSEQAVLISNLGAAGVISKHEWGTGNFIENFAQGLGGPTRMKIGPDNLLYVLQWNNPSGEENVLRFELDGTFVDEFTSTGVPRSIGIDWDSSGDLYVSSYNLSTITKFDGTTGAEIGTFISGLAGPTNIFFEASGNLVVFNYNSGVIARYDPAGNHIEDLITGVNGCEGFDFFPNGDILIGVGSDGTVRRYDSNFNFLGNFVDTGTLLTPNAIVIRDDIPLSTEENVLEMVLVTPTIGTSFRISEMALQKFDEFRVYDSNGKLTVTHLRADGNTLNTIHLSEGIYFISASKDGHRFIQKVVVKR
ncbi:T9SS type A sorting domain-containing protein [Constantimarinum furrinae]|uniref:Secretion system C-terminal sorting domain-containing protein n=1 Tax=Constantimarinum furrinae TaxID=2562285 RepID=A0A7G8PRF5_9FLAO|nr:T9SS type A sorting domain-containing protein [Constantimarinum furrinae]QNJ96921.1 hypothetical protein ALE3EI_0334 [Constantimarinum furrinae]